MRRCRDLTPQIGETEDLAPTAADDVIGSVGHPRLGYRRLMSRDLECVFCDIVAGDADAQMVYEDDIIVAFLPLNPATPGHTLVVPRDHVADFFDVSEPLATELVRATKLVARAVRRAMQPEGTNLITSAGSAAQQTVLHVHVHVLPRFDGDRVGDIWPPDQPMTVSETGRVRRKIASALKSAPALDFGASTR